MPNQPGDKFASQGIGYVLHYGPKGNLRPYTVGPVASQVPKISRLLPMASRLPKSVALLPMLGWLGLAVAVAALVGAAIASASDCHQQRRLSARNIS